MMNLIGAKEKEGGEQGSDATAVSNGNTTRDATAWLLGRSFLGQPPLIEM